MFAFNKKKYTCLICHEDLKRPCFLNLNCDCDYSCHYKCFNEWYQIKPECIICHTPTYGKPLWRKLHHLGKHRVVQWKMGPCNFVLKGPNNVNFKKYVQKSLPHSFSPLFCLEFWTKQNIFWISKCDAVFHS